MEYKIGNIFEYRMDKTYMLKIIGKPEIRHTFSNSIECVFVFSLTNKTSFYIPITELSKYYKFNETATIIYGN